MEHHEALAKVLQEPAVLDKLYDIVRIVNPLKKEAAIYLKARMNCEDNPKHRCYDFWGKDHACDNCIAIRALNEQTTCVKIEYRNGSVWMAMAIPTVLEGEKVAIEFLKDITENSIIDVDEKNPDEVLETINKNNRMVVSDTLTEVYNKRFIGEKLPSDLYFAQEMNRFLTVIFVDIKNLQIINSNHGPAASRFIVKHFARILKKSCRNGGDWVARYNEGEFIILLVDTDSKGAYHRCRYLYNKFMNIKIRFNGKDVELTVGIGFHAVLDEIITPEAFVKKAEQNVFFISEAGKKEDGMKALEQKYRLTAREIEVAMLLSHGLANTKIANKLYISESTVKKHVSNIFDKVQVKTRSEFISRWGSHKMD